MALGDTPIIKYLVRVPGMDPDILHVRVAQTVGELVSVTRGVVGEPLIEMGSKTVNKGPHSRPILQHDTVLRRMR